MAKKAKKKTLDLTLPIYQLKISLEQIDPPVWRQVQMDDRTLADYTREYRGCEVRSLSTIALLASPARIAGFIDATFRCMIVALREWIPASNLPFGAVRMASKTPIVRSTI